MSDNTALHKMAEDFYIEILAPSLGEFTRKLKIPPSFEADRFLLAIAMQESGLEHRYQLTRIIGKAGPARGWGQFEEIGVKGVMQDSPKLTPIAKRWCEHCRVHWHSAAIHRALEGHDALAVGFARLLLWSLPDALPETSQEGWRQYIKAWRPGKPHVKTWSVHWQIADEIVSHHWKAKS
jgi:hypothetical protein